MEPKTTVAPTPRGRAQQTIRRRRWLATLAAALAIGAAAAARGEQAPATPEPPAAPPAGPYRIGGDVAPPHVLDRVPPRYTDAARAARVQGIVIVEAIIDEEGKVRNTRVLKGLPMGLDQAAVDAVAQWRFEPATRLGQPVSVYFILTVNFKVESDFDIGAWLGRFMQEHPDFGALLRERRYGEARSLLDRWEADGGAVTDAELRMARAYTLLAEKRWRDAWREVEGLNNEGIGEILLAIAAFTVRSASEDESLGPAGRAEAIDTGLAAADRALELAPDDRWALLAKSVLLHSKAETTADAEERRALLAEEEALRARAESLAPRPAP